MKTSVVLVSLVASVLFVSVLAVEITDCDNTQKAWFEKLEQYYRSGCFYLDNSSTIGDSIFCKDLPCINGIQDVLNDADYLAMCVTEFGSEFEDGLPWQYYKMEELRQGLIDKCSECAVGYEKFVNAGEASNASHCTLDPVTLDFHALSCDANCVQLRNDYYNKYQAAVSSDCKNPKTYEDMDIYNSLVAQMDYVSSVQTANVLCGSVCYDATVAWYQQWATLQSQGCLVSDTDFSDPTTYFLNTNIAVQGNSGDEDCVAALKDLRSSAVKIPLTCNVGVTAANIAKVGTIGNDATNVSSQSRTPLEIAFALLLLLVVGVFVYFAVAIVVNRYFRNRRGWDQVPHSWLFRCQCTKASYRSPLPSDEMNQLKEEDNASIASDA